METLLNTKPKEKEIHVENRTSDIPSLEKLDAASWEQVREYRRLLDRLDYLKCLSDLEAVKNGNR
jgi:hypothetical protein